MSRYLVERIQADKRIAVRRNTGATGGDTLAFAALFSFIGAEPASEWLSGVAVLDDRGFIRTDLSLEK